VQRPQEDLIPKFKNHTAARLPEVEMEDLRCHLTQGNPVASSIPVVPLVSLIVPCSYRHRAGASECLRPEFGVDSTGTVLTMAETHIYWQSLVKGGDTAVGV
jgi:hypothetical protein